MTASEKIQQLEREIAAIWQIIDDEMLWHPSVIREIQKRSKVAHRSYARNQLRRAEEVFASLRNR